MMPSVNINPHKPLPSTELTAESLLNSIYACYLLVDANLDVFYFNNYYANWYRKFFGGEIKLQSNLLDLVSAQRRPIVQEYAKAALQGACVEYELPFTDAEGVSSWYFIRMNPLRNADELIIGVCLYFADITARKETEMALKASNERYEFVSKVTSEAIWDWNLVENKLYWSEGYETAFGYKRTTEDENVLLWEERVHPEDRQKTSEKLFATIADPNATYWEDEYRFKKADGSYSFIYDRGHIIYEDGKAVRMVGAMSDITNRKLYELEREEMTNELIQRNKDLEQFAFIISHNLRSQIANVLGLSDLLKSGLLPAEEQGNVFNQVHTSVMKLDEVVKDINHILHIKRNISEKKEIVVLENILHDVCESQRKHLDAVGAEVEASFKVPAIYALKSYIHSIFYNLLNNAVKYRNAGKPLRIAVSSETDGNKVIIRFQDNGQGINLDVHGKSIFGLYKRFHNGHEGKGMGLFMVKTQVEAQGGNINVESEPGNGTGFVMSFSKDIGVEIST